MVLRKDEIEAALYADNQEISAGRLKEDNPLDTSESYRKLCEACRRGDLKVVHEKIAEGVNINARDLFDYTPLILASLCGHFEVAQLLLESGALCERDTFQGERCLYNALTDRIRNLLLSYDYSKSTSPLQPLAAHITSLLSRDRPKTWDLNLIWGDDSIRVHKFILAARSPYFAKKLEQSPEITSWRLPNTIPIESIYTTIRFLYFSEVAADLGDDEREAEILTGIDKFSRQVEVDRLFDFALNRDDRRLTRQKMSDELNRGRDEVYEWLKTNVLKNKISIDTDKASDVKWDRDNAIFADVILRADEDPDEEDYWHAAPASVTTETTNTTSIPIGPFGASQETQKDSGKVKKSVLYPAHKAMLIRSEFFLIMFNSAFKEAQESEHLHVISLDCSPEVLEIVLGFLYTEKADFGLDLAIDVLFAADLLLLEKLKVKAATTISSLASGNSVVEADNPRGEVGEEVIDIYEVIRAGWAVRVQRLEEFGARYIANRLEDYIDEEDFEDLIRESAQQVKDRQETDTIVLLDDLRFYLSERFRLRMEDIGLDAVEEEGLDMANFTDKIEGLEISKSGLTYPDDGFHAGVIRTLDGEDVDDEFEEDARNYQILMSKLDGLLERLKLDA